MIPESASEWGSGSNGGAVGKWGSWGFYAAMAPGQNLILLGGGKEAGAGHQYKTSCWVQHCTCLLKGLPLWLSPCPGAQA